MAIVTGKSQRWRVIAAHAGLWVLLAFTLFPLLAVISISLRPGNFATGSSSPAPSASSTGSWPSASPYTQPDGTVVQPPFPVLLWLWNSIKIATISAFLIVAISTTAAYAFARMKFARKSTILNSMLLLQMFPVAVALVAIYAIFEGIGQSIPWLGIETHAGLIVAYWAAWPCTSGPSRATSRPSRWRSRRTPRSTAPRTGRPSARAAADGGADPDGGLRAGLHRHHHRVPGGQHPAARGAQPHARRGQQVLPLRAEIPVGRLRRRGRAVSGLPITLVFLLAQRWIVSGLTAGGVKG
jgi:maltose/maltodextrin transport system permease protein